jgi:tetratricopeptide (TPR) repeat protein
VNDTLWFLFFASWPVACGGILFVCARYFKRAAARWARLRLAAGNALVLLFLGTVAFLGGEIYYRFVYDTTDSFDYTKASVRWKGRYIHVNAQLVRDNIDYQLHIPGGKRRISFVGDSFTAGHGVKDVNDRFANRIRVANPQWDVQVMADPGMDTGEEFDMLKRIVKRGCELDQVVLVYCLNDIADIMPEWKAIVGRIYRDSLRQNWLVRHSYVADILSYRLKARWDADVRNYYDFVLAGYRGPLWEKQKSRLKMLRDLVEANGGHLLVVTFPFLHRPLDEGYEYRFVHQQLGECWRALNLPHLDLLSVYQGLPTGKLVVNRFDAHPNELAHKLAADAIQKFLNQNLSPPAKSNSFAHNAPSAALTPQGKGNEAVHEYGQAPQTGPSFAVAENKLAVALCAERKWDEAIRHFEQALRANPSYAEAHNNLGNALRETGRWAEAATHYEQALVLQPGALPTVINLAWLLATCPQGGLRNGGKAVALAREVDRLSGGNEPDYVDTLAAAYAEAGQFPEAVEAAERALALAVAQDKPFVEDIRARLNLYRQGSPYHQPPMDQ